MIKWEELDKLYKTVSLRLFKQAYKQEPEWIDGYKISYDETGNEIYYISKRLFKHLMRKEK